MNTQTLILAILNFEDASGYEIKKQSSEGAFSYFVDISFGSIYPTLAKLEADGKVTCRIESQNGKPDKKIYSITDKGRQEFISSLAQPPALDKFKSEFLLFSMNANMAPTELLEQAIEDRIKHIKHELELIGSFGADCDIPLHNWVVNYGLHVKNADLHYLETNKDALIALAKAQVPVNAAAE